MSPFSLPRCRRAERPGPPLFGPLGRQVGTCRRAVVPAPWSFLPNPAKLPRPYGRPLRSLAYSGSAGTRQSS